MSLKRITASTAALALTALATVAAATAAPESATDRSLETATFSMYCYWTGEATLGKVPGVVASRIGHLGRDEIVTVAYDPAETHVGELTAALKQQGSFYSVIAISPEEEDRARRHLDGTEIQVRDGEAHFIDSKHSLRTRHPDLYYLDLTERQAITLNSWSYFGGPMPDVLSAEQKKRWSRLRAKLRQERPSGLAPEGSRSGEALRSYRKALDTWLND